MAMLQRRLPPFHSCALGHRRGPCAGEHSRIESRPTTWPPVPTCAAAKRVTTPVPHATSSTRSPSRSAAFATSRGAQDAKIAGTSSASYTSGALAPSCHRSDWLIVVSSLAPPVGNTDHCITQAEGSQLARFTFLINDLSINLISRSSQYHPSGTCQKAERHADFYGTLYWQ